MPHKQKSCRKMASFCLCGIFPSLQQTKEFQDKRVLADMWCTAFVMRKYFPPKEGHPTLPADTPFGITQRHINTFALGQNVRADLLEDVGRVATQYQIFIGMTTTQSITAS